MKIFRKSILREIRRFGADRTLLIMTVIIPLILIVCYTAMFAKGTVHSLPFGVVDQDRTPTSRQLVNMIDATPTAFVSLELQSAEQGEAAMRRGEIDGFILIPPQTEAHIMNPNQQAQVAVYINGAYITNSSLLKRDITTVLQAMNIGVETKTLGAKGVPAAQGYQMAYPVAMDKHVLFNPFGSYSYYLLPGMLSLMLVIMITLTSVYVIGSEFRYGTAREWIETAGGSIVRAITTKLAPYLLIFITISLFYTTILYRVMGLPFEAQSIAIMVAAKVFLVLAYMGVGIIFIALTANMRLSLSIGAAYSIAAFSFAGLTFPHVAMYKPIVWLAQLFPFTFYSDLFIEQSIRGAEPARSLGDLAVLGLFVLISVSFLPLLKKRGMIGEKFYGRL